MPITLGHPSLSNAVLAAGPGDLIEGLIPLIVFAVIIISIVSSIRKAAKTQERAAEFKARARRRAMERDDGDDGGWEAIQHVQRVQPAQRKRRRAQPVPVQPVNPVQHQLFGQLPWQQQQSIYQRDENVWDDYGAPKEPPPPPSAPLTGVQHDRGPDGGSRAASGDAEDELVIHPDLMPNLSNHREIARSVIFAEILQPPLALRGRGRSGAVR